MNNSHDTLIQQVNLTENKLPPLSSSFRSLNNLLYQSYIPKIIHAAIDIELFDLLDSGEKSSTEIATALNTIHNITEALLNVLVAIELIQKKNDKYALTDQAKDFLVKKSPVNQIGAVKSISGSAGPFDHLVEGLTQSAERFNNRMWATKEAVLGIEQNSKAGAVQNVVSFIKELPQFKSSTKMCDLAGNIGYYSFALLNENPDLRSHVYDLLEVCDLAEQLKGREPHINRVNFHGFDIESDDEFGNDYDLFFCSHFLYELGTNERLPKFFKTVNRAMKPGGVFISNHISPVFPDKDKITIAIVELMTRLMGYPTHQLSEEVLKDALSEAGFGEFTVRQPNETTTFPVLLLSAVKLKEV